MTVTITSNLVYARLAGGPLTLDLYRPDEPKPVPAVLYLHGGGFRAGDKTADERRLRGLAEHGIAVASANYRLVPQAIHPAQIHDAKAAVRWLRARSADFGLATHSMGVWGASAGGYLASMLGLTVGDPAMEGCVGDNLDQSSSVEAVVSWFAPSDLIANSRRTWLESAVLGEPAELGLFGRTEIPAPHDDLVRSASPIRRVRLDSPPFLLGTGDRDAIVSEHQTRLLHDALTSYGVDVTSITIGGAGHEDPRFDAPWHLAATANWLRQHLWTHPSGEA